MTKNDVPMERRAIHVRGTVQGVGFRPFVYGLASTLQLTGFVANSGGEVCIEIEGSSADLDGFESKLVQHLPSLARIDEIRRERKAVRGDQTFQIVASSVEPVGVLSIPPDIATCHACLKELFDSHDRRYHYPFLNCTDCGPRLTIVTGAPYDRVRTTMAHFPMCPACRKEYEDPTDRRFHAQPIACPVCGPKLSLRDRDGKRIENDDPLASFAEVIRNGGIGAMKGLGGYHLICMATNEAAVRELRRRKGRAEKPFAVMVPSVSAARLLCDVSETEADLLNAAQRPIVLLPRKVGDSISTSVSPENPHLGLMLPYTPLHHLLLRELDRQPLVMTSGNRSDEPIAVGEPEVFERLGDIADIFLTHNRTIHVRCDDAVARVANGHVRVSRRSRGYAPAHIRLPLRASVPMLAVGAQLKNTFGLAHENRAILSHHIGDLDELLAVQAFERDVQLFEDAFNLHPELIVHDLHPDYPSTRYAVRRATTDGIKTFAVQHHHAHLASCLAEHGVKGPAIGVIFDGTGLGTDRTIWGGEFLVGDLRTFRRVGHLRTVPMPGGDAAVREPWRMAMAHLLDAEVELKQFSDRIDPVARRTVHRMIEREINAPMTSSAGRFFDAVVSLIGLRDRVTFEGQAAMQLEWLAEGKTTELVPYEICISSDGVVDTRLLIRAVAADVQRGVSPATIASKFHCTLIHCIKMICADLRGQTGVATVVLSGGVFQNSLLSRGCEKYLREFGFSVLQQMQVPPNDGGICLGQLAIAAANLAES